MQIIVCVDDGFGMMFNHRRQSQDKILRERILQIIGGSKLWMNDYSNRQFADMNAENIIVDENFEEKAGENDFVFIESKDILSLSEHTHKIYVYKWNRRYPSDLQMTVDLSKWKLESTFEFAGSSHERITEEIYIK